MRPSGFIPRASERRESSFLLHDERERERENSLSQFLNEIAQNAVNWSKDPFLEDERRN